MKGKVLVLGHPEQDISQAALVVDGRLQEFARDPAKGTSPASGAIFLGKVDRVLPNGTGAFVRLTGDLNGYLREAKGLKADQRILVQTSGLPDPGKAIPVSTRLLYKTRRVIHTPGAPGINVSRQIRKPEERDRLSQVVANWMPPADTDHTIRQHLIEMHAQGGFILRSFAADEPEVSIIKDILTALTNRLGVEDSDSQTSGHGALNQQLAASEAIRDWGLMSDLDMIAVSDDFADALKNPATVQSYGLEQQDLELITGGDGDPFDHFGVWDEIGRLKQPLVDLPSGGTMFIEATRAMVTVDVNTGEQFGQGAGMTASIEAARELPRQLRLRGLGGQVIIDFAPIKKMHRKKIEETLKSAFRKDPVATTLAGWTPMGNFELQRKRERRPLTDLL